MLKEELLTVRANLGELLGGLNDEQTELVRDVRNNLLNLADFAGNLEHSLEVPRAPFSMLMDRPALSGEWATRGE
ncbi:MAG: hypothetical protein IJT83_00695 [Victivallales bacterium]|nr:hypothetical protein [Victivallales bacterium]